MSDYDVIDDEDILGPDRDDGTEIRDDDGIDDEDEEDDDEDDDDDDVDDELEAYFLGEDID